MSRTGVFRFVAACFDLRFPKLITLACIVAVVTVAAEPCENQSFSKEERIARFRQLDAQAEQALRNHHSQEAARLYRESTCLEPNSARAFFGLGMAEASAKNFIAARTALRTADALQPTTGQPLLMQVRVNLSLGDQDALKANLREAARRFPADTELHGTLARLLAENNSLILALAETLRFRQIASADPASQVQLAVLENTVGAYADAAQNALAVEQTPGIRSEIRASAAGVAGLSFESIGDREQATHYMNEAIELDPLRENSYLALADLFEQSGDYLKAVTVLRTGQHNLPDSTAFLLPLGSDLIRTEHYAEGIDLLKRLLRASPNIPEAYMSLADAARKTGNSAEELQALQSLSRINPDFPMIRMLLARALLNAQPADYQKVLEELSQAEKANPEDPDASYLRGKAYFSLGRFNDARLSFERSVELRPMDPGPYLQLAKTYQKLNEPKKAREQFERVKYLEKSEARP